MSPNSNVAKRNAVVKRSDGGTDTKAELANVPLRTLSNRRYAISRYNHRSERTATSLERPQRPSALGSHLRAALHLIL
jgi:hypothetical protein